MVIGRDSRKRSFLQQFYSIIKTLLVTKFFHHAAYYIYHKITSKVKLEVNFHNLCVDVWISYLWRYAYDLKFPNSICECSIVYDLSLFKGGGCRPVILETLIMRYG